MIRADRLLRLLCSVLALMAAPVAFAGGGEALPPWVTEVSARPGPTIPATADSIILLNEVVFDYAPDGRLSTRQRTVLRVLHHEGREQARAGVAYQRPADKVRELNAWLQTGDGKVRHFGRKETVDLALEPDTLYSESRSAVIDASREADSGSLFAWESLKEEPPSLAQGGWTFQQPWPVAVSRCIIRLPKGWRAEGRMINHPAAVAPVATETGPLWELRDLPGLSDEPLAPNSERRCAGLRFNILPATDSKGRTPLRTFATWADLSRFMREKFTPALRPTPAVDAKTRELCLGLTTEWDKIRAIAGFVQHLRYVAISMNLHQDGGYIPHSAAEVLHCGYGDCKDKTALLCTMLASAGITAHPVLCFSGDRTAVQADWPSPRQFNHVFAGIQVDPSVASPFVIDDPHGGRLLLFDPTDADTPIGEFPRYNQGGLVLVGTPGADGLTPVPHDPTGAYRVLLHTTAVIAPSGAVEVNLTESNQRSAAAAERGRRQQLAKLGKTTTDWLKETLPGAVVQEAAFQESPTDGTVILTAKFTVPKFGQTIRRDMLAIKPLVAWGMSLPPLNAKTRALPILLSSTRNEIVAEFAIPDGFQVADPGPAVVVERSFGRYEAKTECDGQKAVFRRTFLLQPIELTLDKYAEVKSFFDAVRKRENTPFLIERRGTP